MQQSDLKEAAAVLRALLVAIGGAPSARTSIEAGALRQALGSLDASAEAEISGLTFGAGLVSVFGLLRVAGVTFTAVEAIRVQAFATATVSALAGVVADAVMLQALVSECRILADTTFESRDQVDSYRAVLNAAFDGAIDQAADNFDQVTTRALVSLRAAVVRDLTARARPLPQIVAYSFPIRRPSLWIAQRLYGDGSRYLELATENQAVHPLFMPAAGRALSR